MDADASVAQLNGSCACERNQYTIRILRAAAESAHVFLDNSAAARRPQAAPITAWLRVPLAWYHSVTLAASPDETHASIRRSYYSLPPRGDSGTAAATAAVGQPTRRQFCGYCGSHLTAWDESRSPGAADLLDVTLGSLTRESLELLAELDLIPDDDEEDESGEANGAPSLYDPKAADPVGLREDLVKGGSVVDEVHVPTRATAAETDGLVKGGTIVEEDHVPSTTSSVGARELHGLAPAPHDDLVKGGTVVDEDHISTGERAARRDTMGQEDDASLARSADTAAMLAMGGTVVDEDHIATNEPTASRVAGASKQGDAPRRSLHLLQHRGIPYFEDMVQDSRLGRIRRRAGRHTSANGRFSHQWEITEIGPGSLEGGNVVTEPASIDESAAADFLDVVASSSKRRRLSP